MLAQSALDLHGQFPGGRHLPFGGHQLAGHLVDRAHLLDRQAGVDGFQFTRRKSARDVDVYQADG
jgi:hypothetical protein